MAGKKTATKKKITKKATRKADGRQAARKAIAVPDLTAVVVFKETKRLTGRASAVNQDIDGALAAALKDGDFKGGAGEVWIHRTGRTRRPRVAMIGLGAKDTCDAEILRRVGAALRMTSKGCDWKRVAIEIDDVPSSVGGAADVAEAITEGYVLAGYDFDHYKSKKASTAAELDVLSSENAREIKAAVQRGTILADGTNTARDVCNLPGNDGSPKTLARIAKQIATKTGLRSKTMLPAEMKKRKMEALLSVAAGSAEEARLIVLDHNPGKRNQPVICIVGKGITFDTGGISLKPGADMDKMRHDKGGGSAVIGAMEAVARLKLPARVIGIVPAAENMPGSAATRPGDVVTASNGKTIEVLNTDAEGRMVLADALVHAQQFKPDYVIDLATLTGACMIALGGHCAGLFTTDDDLARRLVQAGEATHERLWRLPLWPEYADEMKGTHTDLKNLGPRGGGACTAAAFLQSFVGDLAWAHLDIAPVAWNDSVRPYNKGKGATGFGARVLVQFIEDVIRSR